MRWNGFAVFDKVANCFLLPFFVRAPGEGVRMLREMVNDGKSPFARNPGDYVLYRVAEFDDANGRIFPLDHGPERAIDAVELVTKVVTVSPVTGERMEF